MAKIYGQIAAAGKMTFDKSFSRMNGQPLDASEVYYNLADAEAYAATSAAYVGQKIVVVDEENNVVKHYSVELDGSLKELGATSIGDQKSIVVAPDNTISLRGVAGLDFVKRGEDGEPELDEEGNEQKVNYQPLMTEAGLVWTIPSETTVEGLGAIVGTVQNQVTELVNEVGTAAKPDEGIEATGLFATVENFIEDTYAKDQEAVNKSIQDVKDTYLPLAGGTLTGVLTLVDGYEAVSKNYVDSQIAAEIGSAGHLKREIVDTLPAVEDADPDTIYMIKSGLALTGDKYQEYMLINGDFEMIGDTSIDLEPYAKKVEGAVENNLAALAADGALIDAGIALQDVADHLADEGKHITADEREIWNEGAALAATNATAIDNLVKISQDDADKLAALPVITEIGDNLELVDGVLSAVAEQYELPAATAESLGGVKVGTGLAIDGEGVLSVPVVEDNGLTLGENGIALAIASDSNAGALSAEMFTKLKGVETGAQENKIESIMLAGTLAEITGKQVSIPYATELLAGLVHSSTADNEIAVAEDGTMSLNRVSVEKLFVPEDMEFILDGGNAE
jgi:hypothetical protein